MAPLERTAGAAERDPRRLESRYLAVGPWTIHARVATRAAPSDACPVVFVHGIGVSSRYFVPTAQRLASLYPVFAPDLPGFGLSSRPRETLSVSELSEALALWMTAAGLDRAALVGNSVGCQVAVDLAMRWPEKVARLVLVGPTMDRRGRTVFEQIRRWLVDAPRERPSLALVILRDYVDCGPRRLWRSFRYALEDDIEERMPSVEAPVLVMRGERDPIVPLRWASELAGAAPQARVAEAAGAPHAVNYSAPDALVEWLRPFLAGDR